MAGDAVHGGDREHERQAMTLRPSMRSRCASIHGCAGEAADHAAAAKAEPAMIRNSLQAEGDGAISAVPRNTCVNRLAVSGVTAVQTRQARERERGVEPHQRGERRRRHQAGRRHLQHQHEIKPGQAGAEAERQEHSAEQQPAATSIIQSTGGGDQARAG